jgi:hypothetical protein
MRAALTISTSSQVGEGVAARFSMSIKTRCRPLAPGIHVFAT